MKRFGILIGALLLSTNLWGSTGDLDMYREDVLQSEIPLMPLAAALASVNELDLSAPFEGPIFFSDTVQIEEVNYSRLGMVHKPGLDCKGLNGVVTPEISITLYYTRPESNIRNLDNVIMHVTGAIARDERAGDEFDPFCAFAPFVLHDDHIPEAE